MKQHTLVWKRPLLNGFTPLFCSEQLVVKFDDSTSCCATDSCEITTLLNLKKKKRNKQNQNKNKRNDFNADTHHSVNCLLVWVTSVSLYSPKCPEPLTLTPPDLSSDMSMALIHAIISHAGFRFSRQSSYLSERSFRKNQRVCCLAPNTSASLALHSLTSHGDTGDRREKKKQKPTTGECGGDRMVEL